MRRIYESFEELGQEMCNGDGVLHTLNCPGPKECLAWQAGVMALARWLDHVGIKVSISDEADNFYELPES